MARLGNIAAAPFVGDQFVSLYLGETRVPTLPGKPPTLTVADPFDNDQWVAFVGVPADGGSDITDYRVYVNGVLDETAPYEDQLNQRGFILIEPGDVVRASAVNAVGEGPKSDPFIVT